MLRYSLRRLLIGVGMLFALSVLIFVMLRLTPGDPIDAYARAYGRRALRYQVLPKPFQPDVFQHAVRASA